MNYQALQLASRRAHACTCGGLDMAYMICNQHAPGLRRMREELGEICDAIDQVIHAMSAEYTKALATIRETLEERHRQVPVSGGAQGNQGLRGESGKPARTMKSVQQELDRVQQELWETKDLLEAKLKTEQSTSRMAEANNAVRVAVGKFGSGSHTHHGVANRAGDNTPLYVQMLGGVVEELQSTSGSEHDSEASESESFCALSQRDDIHRVLAGLVPSGEQAQASQAVGEPDGVAESLAAENSPDKASIGLWARLWQTEGKIGDRSTQGQADLLHALRVRALDRTADVTGVVYRAGFSDSTIQECRNLGTLRSYWALRHPLIMALFTRKHMLRNWQRGAMWSRDVTMTRATGLLTTLIALIEDRMHPGRRHPGLTSAYDCMVQLCNALEPQQEGVRLCRVGECVVTTATALFLPLRFLSAEDKKVKLCDRVKDHEDARALLLRGLEAAGHPSMFFDEEKTQCTWVELWSKLRLDDFWYVQKYAVFRHYYPSAFVARARGGCRLKFTARVEAMHMQALPQHDVIVHHSEGRVHLSALLLHHGVAAELAEPGEVVVPDPGPGEPPIASLLGARIGQVSPLRCDAQHHDVAGARGLEVSQKSHLPMPGLPDSAN
jgi:hypothetical protein